ncbi:MAG: pirin family protein [Elusimicrobia bacterium]|nr:MAG: pirin family protein [Elusimicrobiota bacterium]KAF0153984.1 MAG: pirin family protein [Elusimicrobiota bacterium]
MTRKIKKIFRAKPTMEGAGVSLKRGFGYAEVPQFDPFLMFDDFRSGTPADYLAGFPWHPHRGIETITYMIAGSVEHGDSMGNKGVIRPGEVQWMTAGSGVIHQEMPKGDKNGAMGGFQLWANLPAARKMMDPRYREVKKADIPEVELAGGVTARVVAGKVGGVQGPVRDIVIDPEYLDVTVPAGRVFEHAVPDGHTAIAYAVEGGAWFDEGRGPFDHDVAGGKYFDFKPDCLVRDGNVVLYERAGGAVRVTAGDAPARFLLVSGRPLGEPIAWYGPIVMNTREELRRAFEEYENGTFVKNGAM